MAISKKDRRRLVLFILGSRVIDFDAYLPTAMELKRARPGWQLRFITFAKSNYDFIQKNPTLMAGLEHCGTLHYMGSEMEPSFARRQLHRFKTFSRIAGWLFHRPGPVLFLARPYVQFPLNLFYAMVKLRGGLGILLQKTWSPEEVYRFTRLGRGRMRSLRMSWFNRLLGRDLDGIVHYHSRQQGVLDEIASYGRIYDVPWRRVGMPHLLPAWRELIAEQTALERSKLAEQGLPEDAGIYCTFAPKGWSSVHLRSEKSVPETFMRVMRTLLRVRPNAILLVRPHPLAVDADYLKAAEAEAGPERFRISFAHPEVLSALSRRTLYINPTTIMFSCFPGRHIDLSDYPQRHYDEYGQASLADGLGVVFVNPASADFEARFTKALNDDEQFEDPKLCRGMNALLAEGPSDVAPLISWIESGVAPPDKTAKPRFKPDGKARDGRKSET